MINNKHKDLIFIIIIVLAGIYYRLIPHLPNFSPLVSISVFSSIVLPKKINKYLSFLLPIIILFSTDIILGFYSSMIFVYLSFLISSIISYYLDKFFKLVNLDNPKKILKNLINSNILSLINTITFFLISNLGVFLTTNMYEKSFKGLTLCYIMAIPFLKNSIIASIVFTTIIFLIYQYFYKSLYNLEEKYDS